MPTPDDIKHTVLEMLSVGAGLLLPQLRERMELLHSLLPTITTLTAGQKMLMDIILNSLEDHCHIAALLSYSTVPEKLDIVDLHLTESLMGTLLENLNLYTEECLDNISKCYSTGGLNFTKNFGNPQIQHLSRLLSSLQNHLLAYCSLTSPKVPTFQSSILLLENHLLCLFPLAAKTFKKAADIVETNPAALEVLYNVMLESLAGAMLLKLLTSLLLLPITFFQSLLFRLLEMLTPLDKLNSLLPEDVQCERNVSGKFILFSSLKLQLR